MCVGVIVAIFAMICAWMLTAAYTTSWEAEKTLHAYMLVLDVVDAYVQKTGGKWPRSWNDLYSVNLKVGIWKWPQDHQEVKKRISIDFSTDCEQVSNMTTEQFSAIQQTSPNYGPPRGRIDRLIQDCRREQEDVNEDVKGI